MSAKPAPAKCSKCGAPADCNYLGDQGGVDYYFTWEHVCRVCGHREEFVRYVGIGQEYEGMDETCPGCGTKREQNRSLNC